MIDSRKQDHLKICVKEDVEAGDAGFAGVELVYEALPELDFSKIRTETTFLGKRLDYPIILNGMTGGTKKSEKINRDLASVAQEYGVGFGVGSQRAAIEDPSLAGTYVVRDVAPDILLVANLGAVQLNYGYGIRECRKAVEMIGADALALHINPLQEVIQPEGNKNFEGLVKKINKIGSGLGVPVIAKCVGSGISRKTAEKLSVDAFDVGGVGGTSWSLVESFRGDGVKEAVGKTFAGWGIRTVDCIRGLSGLKPVVGSGGVRSGVDAAKAIALGADVVGVALPVLRAWFEGGRGGVQAFLDRFILEFRISMFLSGSGAVGDLRGKIR